MVSDESSDLGRRWKVIGDGSVVDSEEIVTGDAVTEKKEDKGRENGEEETKVSHEK